MTLKFQTESQERLENTIKLHKALSAIQTDLVCPKNLYNNFGKYHYRNAEGIQESVKPLLKKDKLSLVVNDEIVLIGDRFYVKATATLYGFGSSISCVAYAREPESKKGMDSSQITGSTSSYARKYALNGLLAIDDNKDPDHPSEPEKTKPKKAEKVVMFDVKNNAHSERLDQLLSEMKIEVDTKKYGEVLNDINGQPLTDVIPYLEKLR